MYIRTHICTDGCKFIRTYPHTENRKTIWPWHHPMRGYKNDHLWLFFYIIYMFFISIQHSWLANVVVALDTSNNFIKRLWCTSFQLMKITFSMNLACENHIFNESCL